MKILKRVLLGLLVVTVILVLGFVYWANDAAQATDVALKALESDPQVVVDPQDGYVAFSPVGQSPTTGFIFYPGGRVDYRAYAPVLRMIAQQGYFVAVVDVNLNLAFCEINTADAVISNHPGQPAGRRCFASPLNMMDFVKITSIVALDEQTSTELSRMAAEIAQVERLTAHESAARFRGMGSDV